MSDTSGELFVLFEFRCSKCGTNLQVHGEYYLGARQCLESVECPKCREKHDLPTKALRVYYENGDHWVTAFVEPVQS